MRAEQPGGSQSDTLSPRDAQREALRRTVPLDLEALAPPRIRIDPQLLMEFLRDPMQRASDPVAETLNTQRRRLLSLVDGHTAQESRVGFGMRPADPLDITELRDHMSRSLMRLEGLYELGRGAVSLTQMQREIILQANTVLREFLISMSEIARDGMLNASDTGGFLRQCVGVGQILGQMALALESARSGVGRAFAEAELSVEAVENLTRGLDRVDQD